MPYVRPAPALTGAMLTAQQWNQFIVENFAVGVPGQVAAKGDLIVGADKDRAVRFPATFNSLQHRRGLRVNANGAMVWDLPIMWRWASPGPIEISPTGTPTPIPMQNANNISVTPVREGNSYVVTIPETGTYEFIGALLMLIGVGGVVANQVAQLYVGVNDTNHQLARWTVPVNTGAHATNLMNGELLLNCTAGDEIRFRLRNEMHVRIVSGFGCFRRVR